MLRTPAIGIDLGTHCSCVGIYQHGKVEIIANEQGNRTTPSYVAFCNETGERLIGDRAKMQSVRNPTDTIFATKRIVGRRYVDKHLQSDIAHWPFRLIADKGWTKIETHCRGERKRLAPEECSSMVLAKMRETAESYLGEAVQHAVITVPACFTDAQRTATLNAAKIAGLNVLSLCNEPTAAALAYGRDQLLLRREDRTVIIFDLGAGKLDVSVLAVHDGGTRFDVLATAGNSNLGGEDFDNRLVIHFAHEFRRRHHKRDLNVRALQRLKTAAEQAKRTLSEYTEATVHIADLMGDGIEFCAHISRSRFVELCADLFRHIIEPVSDVLVAAKLAKHQIDDVVLVGGSTRMPKVQSELQQFFNGKSLNLTMNPDETIACGAAIIAAVLSADRSIDHVRLVDVLPFTLVVEMGNGGGSDDTVIERNSPIPFRKSIMITTTADNQSAVTIHVYERVRANENNVLGKFNLSGISPAPSGVPRIEIILNFDSNGILNISAHEDVGGARTKNIRIKSDKGHLSRADIDEMVAEAERYREQDELAQERMMARNSLESYVLGVKQALRPALSYRQKINYSDRKCLMAKCGQMLKWLETNWLADVDELEERKSEMIRFCVPFIGGGKGRNRSGCVVNRTDDI